MCFKKRKEENFHLSFTDVENSLKPTHFSHINNVVE